MLNVIALHPALKKQSESKTLKRPAFLSHRLVVKNPAKGNSGRLFCEDDTDIEVPQYYVYAAR